MSTKKDKLAAEIKAKGLMPGLSFSAIKVNTIGHLEYILKEAGK